MTNIIKIICKCDNDSANNMDSMIDLFLTDF